MATIITRSGKGSPLTNTEVDNNFTNLNSDKLESGDTVASLTLTSADINGGTIDGAVIGGSTPAAISGTTGQFGTSLNVDGTVTADGLTVDANSGNIELQWAAGSTHKVGSSFSTTYFTGMRVTESSKNTDIISLDASGIGNINLFTGSAETKRMSVDPNGDISFYEDTGTTPKFFWDASAESLGIGTTSPAAKLEVTGDALTTWEAASTKFIGSKFSTTYDLGMYMDTENRKLTLSAKAGDSTGTIAFQTGVTPSEAMRIDSSGRVGIGTSAPNNKAQVSYTSVAAVPSAGAGGHGFAVGDSGFGIAAGALTSGNGYLQATRWDGSATNYNLILQPNGGSVGIGTSSPTISTGYGTLSLNGTTGGQIAFQTNTVGSAFIFHDGVNGNLNLFNSQAGNTIFLTNSTERMRIDASGNVGIGTSSPAATFGSRVLQVAGTADANSEIRLTHTTSGTGSTDGFTMLLTGSDGYLYNRENGPLILGTNNTERMRIDASGNVGIGTSSDVLVAGYASKFNFVYPGGGSRYGFALRPDADTTTAIVFCRADGAAVVGSITQTASATAYNTSSDYRLKEDVQPMVGASDRLMALKPVNFAWKVDGSRVDGFLAHEAQEVVPEAVTGEKDGEEMQGIDQSKLVPLLTAALQEALTKIKTLEARVAALENQ